MATTERDLRAFDPGLWAHYTAMIVGGWFFMSSLVWHDAMVWRSLDWILGLAVIGLAVMSFRRPRLHWGVSIVGAFLLLWSVIVPHMRETTAWNERVVGVLLLLLGLVGGGQLPEHDE